MKKCLMKLNSRCHSNEHYGQICGALNQLVCPTRRAIDRALSVDNKMLKIKRPDEPLGIGS